MIKFGAPRVALILFALAMAGGGSCSSEGSDGQTPTATISTTPSVAASATASPVTGTNTPATPGDRPNIVVILLDDARADEWHYMPNVARLIGDAGVAVPNFVVTNPLCCPSRVSFLRGQYSHNHGVVTNNNGFQNSRRLETPSLATVMQAAGYATGFFGKYLNGYEDVRKPPPVPKGWDRWVVAHPPRFYDYNLSIDGTDAHYGDAPEDHLDLVTGNFLIDWVEEASAADAPFLAFWGVRAPHQDERFEPRYADLFPEITVEFQRNRARSLQTPDALIAELVTTLDSLGELDNTYIFVTNDNGYAFDSLGEADGKREPYEEVVNVGLFARGPGIPAGSSTDAILANIDLLPTLAEIGGAALPRFVDGRSALGLLEGDDVPWREAILIEAYNGGRAGGPTFRAYRTADTKYVEWEDGRVEQYDLIGDPGEDTNLASGPDPARSAYLAELGECRRDACRELEDAPPE